MYKYLISAIGSVAVGAAISQGLDFHPAAGGLLSGGIFWLRIANF